MANYYDQDFEPWVRGLHSIAGMMAQAPALRAQAAVRESQAAENQARMGLLLQQTRGAQTEADLKGFNLESLRGLSDVLGRNTLTSTNQDGTVSVTFRPESIAGLMSRFAGSSANGQNAALAVDRFSKTANAPGEANKNRQAQATRSAATDANRLTIADRLNASREKMAADKPTTLSPGAAVWKDGKVLYTNPSAANEEYKQTREEFEGSPGEPGEGVFGQPGWKPGTPPQPKRVITQREKINRPAPSAANDPLAAIPPGALKMLRDNPDLATAFDEKYGAGMSKLALQP